MRVTPLEIRQQQFPVRFRGLDPAEVDKFLELVASDMEELLRENARLKDGLVKKDQELQRMQRGEDELKKALMAIQQIREDWIGRAEKEAEHLLRESEAKAKQMVLEAERQLATLQQDVQALRRQRRDLIAQLRQILEQHLQLLQSIAGDEEELTASDDLPRPLQASPDPPHQTGGPTRRPPRHQDG
jgi:cell division initiation protein